VSGICLKSSIQISAFLSMQQRRTMSSIFTGFHLKRCIWVYSSTVSISNGSLPADKIAQKKLSLLSNAASLTLEPKSVPELPEIAPKISGKTYPLNTNPWKYNNFKLIFDSEKDYAEFSYTAKENDVVHYRVGLNGVHQLTETNNNTYAAVGSWTSPNTFSIDCEIIGYSTKDKWNLTFNGDEILIEEVGVTGKYKYRGKIQQHE